MKAIASRARVWALEGLDRALSAMLLRRAWRERMCRQLFLSNAFRALTFNGIDGDYAEFGCWGGMTFSLADREARRYGHPAKLWAFDSFQGLPPSSDAGDKHPAWVEGALSTSIEQFHSICAAKGVPRSAYNVVPGFYEESLNAMAADDAPRNIALAYVDCDLLSSTRCVLEFLLPRLKHGMIIAFDDYFCWSATAVAGERRATLEVLEGNERWALLPYMQYGWHGMSFVVEARALRQSEDS